MIGLPGPGESGSRDYRGSRTPRLPLQMGNTVVRFLSFHSTAIAMALLCSGLVVMQRPGFTSHADSPLSQLAAIDLQSIEAASIALEQSRWEDALLEMLVLKDHLRRFVTPLHPERRDQQVIAQVRDRAWRHLRDRLACAERPHGSMEMLELFARLQRIPIVCIAAGIETPRHHERVLSHWRRRIELRKSCDQVLRSAQQHYLEGNEVEAIKILDPLLQRLPDDAMLDRYVTAMRQGVIEQIAADIREGKQRNDPCSVLTATRWLGDIDAEDPGSRAAGQWARQQLRDDAEFLLTTGQPCGALLKMAILLDAGEPIGDRLVRLRSSIEIPLRPIVIRGALRGPIEVGRQLILRPGVATVTAENSKRTLSARPKMGENGRVWSRSPAHFADVKRWNQLIGEIVDLTHRWIPATPVDALLLSARRSFRLAEALRLSRRLAVSPARRWRTVWSQQLPSRNSESWVIHGTLPVVVIDEMGRGIEQCIEVQLAVAPSDLHREGLPVTRSHLEEARNEVLATLEGKLEILAQQIARQRLTTALQRARDLALAGDLPGARELLLPALIGADEHDQDLQQEAAIEIAHWCQVQLEIVKVATRLSDTP